MNKKYLVVFSLVFITLFCFKTNVFANVHTGISYDANEHFNIFYEVKENTPMANLLLSKDIDSLVSTSVNKKFIIILSSSDFEKYYGSDISLPSDYKYALLYGYPDGGYGSCKPLLYKNDDTYYFSSVSCKIGLKLYDENADVVTSYSYFSNNSLSSPKYVFKDTDKEDIENFTYLVSSLWYGFPELNGLFEKTYVTDVLYDDERLLIDDSKVNENIFTKIKSKWLSLTNSDSLIDANQLNLKYFQENPYLTDIQAPIGTYNILNYSNKVIPPSGFESLNFKYDNYKVDAYFFFPKNINSSNRNLYGYTTDLPRKSFANDDSSTIKQSVQAFSVNDKNVVSVLSEEYVDYHVKYKENFKLYNLGYKTKLADLYPDIDFNSTIISVSHAIKYDSVLYYNPKAFSVCPLYTQSDGTYSSCTFTNPVNGEEVTLSGEEFYEVASSGNGLGVSSNVFDDAETQRETASKYSELYETDENGNITGFSLSNVLKSLSSFLSNIISVISVIFTYFTKFFNALPVEIRGLLYFGLIGGILLLFWKLIK